MWALAGSLVALVAFSIDGLSSANDPSRVHSVTELFTNWQMNIFVIIGIVIIVFGLVVGIKGWRWRLHVDESGLVLTPGLGTVRTLSYGQIGSVSFVTSARQNMTVAKIKEPGERTFAQVVTTWEGATALVVQLKTARPDLFGPDSSAAATTAP